jgi:predicted outer membrane repeat protein
MHFKLFISFAALFAFKGVFAWVSVGSSPDFGLCDFSTIQQAINSNESEIRILNDSNFNQNFIENLIVDHSLDIKGGFPTCFAASLNQAPTSNSVIKGSATIGSPVVEIISSDSPTIRFYNVTLKDATDTIFVTNGGNGIDVGSSNGLIEVIDSLIVNNSAEEGGGIYVGNTVGTLNLVITNSSVFGNSASIRGGGVFCAGADATIRVSGVSLIGENSAEDGAGIAALNGCSVTVDSGTADLNGELRGIIGNTASQFGGGVYLNSGASLALHGDKYGFNLLGDNTNPVTVANNTAGEKGGAIYAINSSVIEITDGFVTNNQANSSFGGAFYLGSSNTQPVILNMQSSNGQCWNVGQCSILSENKTTSFGGALYLDGAAQATVSNTRIFRNRAGFGTFLYISANVASGATATIEGSYIYKNGTNGSGSYTDNFVVRAFGDVETSLLHNTLVDNDVNDSRAILGANNTNLEVKNSIINNANETVLETIGANNLDINCLIANENSSITAAVLNPVFVDSANENYHLQGGSPAIDRCADVASSSVDTDGENRGWDDPTLFDLGGVFDTGADETYSNDIIFSSNFE